MDKKIMLYVVSHKEEDIVTIRNDDLYTPIFVGRNGKDNLGFVSDDTGDNISEKNKYYSELTALYWMCKNSDADIIGLNHYRRYFAKGQFSRILERRDVEELLQDCDMVVPEIKESLSGSIYENYSRWSQIKGVIDSSKEIIIKKYPDYVDAFNLYFEGVNSTYFNMFIASKDLMKEYCEWIFPILDEVVEKTPIPENPRIYGTLSEYLFNVWILKNNLQIKQCPLKYVGTKYRLRMFIIGIPLFRKLYKFYFNTFKK